MNMKFHYPWMLFIEINGNKNPSYIKSIISALAVSRDSFLCMIGSTNFNFMFVCQYKTKKTFETHPK